MAAQVWGSKDYVFGYDSFIGGGIIFSPLFDREGKFIKINEVYSLNEQYDLYKLLKESIPNKSKSL